MSASSIRLTQNMREGICHAMLLHRFTADVVTLASAYAELAGAIYDDVFTPADRRRIGALPAGWLPIDTFVRAKFPDGAVPRIAFNGKPSRTDVHRYMPKLGTVARAFPHNRLGQCLKVYEAQDPIAATAEDLTAQEIALNRQIETAKAQITAALGRITTVARLVEMWPEVTPFAAAFTQSPPPLPAIPVAQLNDLLKLPVEGRA